MPSKSKQQPTTRKTQPADGSLILISRILLDVTALVLLYLFLHLHWKLL